MIVVATRTSNLRATKSSIAFSSWSSSIWPWPIAIFASGTSRVTRLAIEWIDSHAVVHDVDLPAALELVRTARAG